MPTDLSSSTSSAPSSPPPLPSTISTSFTSTSSSPIESPSSFPPLHHVVLAGAIGGVLADFTMHSVDTVKTRLQAQSSPVRYSSTFNAVRLMKRQEGLRGFYGGLSPAMGGSLLGTAIYFASYDTVKKNLLETSLPPSVTFLIAGALGDLVASIVYVPSEILKIRLQLQGVYNNPYSMSSYNYKSTKHAIKSMYKMGALAGFYDGFKATLVRDVPFSALQFMFYETFKSIVSRSYGETLNNSLLIDMGTGALAGGLAGGMTTPFDVLKTKLQTQPRARLKYFESIPPTTSPSPLPCQPSAPIVNPSPIPSTLISTSHATSSSKPSLSPSISTSSSLPSSSTIKTNTSSHPSSNLTPKLTPLSSTSASSSIKVTSLPKVSSASTLLTSPISLSTSPITSSSPFTILPSSKNLIYPSNGNGNASLTGTGVHTGGGGGSNPFYRLFSSTTSYSNRPPSIWASLKGIYRSQGIKGLFKGLGPRCTWAALQSGIMFGVYETIIVSIE